MYICCLPNLDLIILVGLDPKKPDVVGGIVDVSPKSATSNPVLVS